MSLITNLQNITDHLKTTIGDTLTYQPAMLGIKFGKVEIQVLADKLQREVDSLKLTKYNPINI